MGGPGGSGGPDRPDGLGGPEEPAAMRSAAEAAAGPVHSPEQLGFPTNWDRLARPMIEDRDPLPELGAERSGRWGAGDEQPAGAAPPVLNLVAASWADLVSLLGFCTVCLLAIVVAGYGVALDALPWIVAAAVAWWCAAAAVLVVVRRGTPGMLMAGVVFAARVPGRRLPTTLAVAIVQSCLLGLPAVVGARRAPLALASGAALGAAADVLADASL
jgi:hypothetical protein